MLNFNFKSMKNYKNLITITLSAIMCFVTSSCKKDITQFLEKGPGVDITENTIFTSKEQVDVFLATIYKYGLPSTLAYRDASLSTTGKIIDTDVVHPSSDMTDESDASEVNYLSSNVWNSAGILPSNIISKEDYRFYTRFIALRQIAIMLNRIDEVPDLKNNQAYKDQVIAEVKSIRALIYLEMVKRYGGMPIVDHIFEPGVLIDAPRNTIEDCFKFIVKDCDEAISSNALPNQQSASLAGRITAMVPYAIKARALLYAASPLFNTATPYTSMNNPANNKFICYGNYDVNRWKLASDAAKAALDKAATSGVTLINDPNNTKGRYPNLDIDPSTNNYYQLGKVPVAGNYEHAWSDYNNSEIILTFQGYPKANYFNTPWSLFGPKSTGVYWSGLSVNLNLVRKYEKLDGTPQTWNLNGGTDLIAKYRELDPRFKQSIAYTTSYFNATYSNMSIYEGGPQGVNCPGGNWMRKMIPLNIRTGGSPATLPNDIILKLNEIYLNFAEASNEFSGPSTEAYAAVNTIRARSGMPALPAGLSKDDFRIRVRNERAVEMAFDDCRFWDIRRWLIGEDEGVMQGEMLGIKTTKSGNLYNWKPFVFETRTFTKSMYLHPIPQSEVLKGQLLQNPGW